MIPSELLFREHYFMITESKLMSKIFQSVDQAKSLYNAMEIFRSVMLINNVWVTRVAILTAMVTVIILHRK